jgi:hypothetical protein
MRDGNLDNRVRMNSFHGISARHIPEYTLKSPVGEVRSHHIILRMGRTISQPLESLSLCVVSGKIAFILHDGGTLVPKIAPCLRPSA